MAQSLKNHTHHLDRKLRIRLQIYFLISLVFLGIFIYNIARGALRIDFGLIAMAAGVVIGAFTSRMFHTRWDKDAAKVVSRIDMYGIVILALYIAFEIFRGKIIGYVTHDFEVGTIGFALLAGIMFGRVLGTRGRIIEILKEQKII
jgi:hypothetical protein